MEGTIAPEQVIINGQEYSPEDATQLIELGNKYKEMEGKLNTSLDKVYPEYTRATQRNKELETELADRTTRLEALQKQQDEFKVKAETPEDIQKARQAARAIGLADEDYLKEKGYVRKEDLETYFTQKQNQQKQVESVLATASQLEKQIDGSDGRAPFDQRAVLAYASAYNIADLTDAYEQMNEKGNAAWKAKQLAQSERPGLTTLKPGGKKSPPVTKYTDDNVGQALSEWLNGIPE